MPNDVDKILPSDFNNERFSPPSDVRLIIFVFSWMHIESENNEFVLIGGLLTTKLNLEVI